MSDLITRAGQTANAAPIIPQVTEQKYSTSEVLIDIPSKAWDKAPSVVDQVEDAQVVDEKPINPLMALSINEDSKRLITEALRAELNGRYRSDSDVDGFKFSIVWGLLEIEAVHHYTWNELHHHLNDKIEIVGVYDLDGEALPGLQTQRVL